jgi:hypothetical protein
MSRRRPIQLHLLLSRTVRYGFLFERFELPAAVVLIGVYAIAAVITVLDGQVPIRFVFFAVTAFYIVYSRHVMKIGNSSVG